MAGAISAAAGAQASCSMSPELAGSICGRRADLGVGAGAAVRAGTRSDDERPKQSTG